MNSLKKIKLRYWLIGSLALGVLMLMLAIRAQFVDVPLRVSPSTTYVTAPLKADGKSVDFFAALKQKYEDKAVIQSEENGFRYLVQHLSNFEEELSDQFEILCTELELNLENYQPSVRFITFRNFAFDHVKSAKYDEVFFRQLADELGFDKGRFIGGEEEAFRNLASDVLFDRCRKPWTLEDLPIMQEWLTSNETAFEVIAMAARKTEFAIPLMRGSAVDATLEAAFEPGLSLIKNLAIGLVVRANLRIGSGDVDGAIDDLEICKRLGVHLENMPFYMPHFFGRDVQHFCHMVGINGSAQHAPNKRQLERIKGLHHSLQDRQSFEGLVFWGRLAFLECMHEEISPLKTSFMGGREKEDGEKKRMLELGVNWNLVARRVNERFDVLSKDIFNPPRVNSPDEWTLWDTISIRHRSNRFATLLVDELDLAPYEKGFHEAKCRNQLQQITLAMLIYEKDHGRLPPAFTVDSNGKRLHSWRVLLLPYLGQNELYQKIRLDEPWDSAHNKKFWTHSVPIYQCPADKGTNFGDVGPTPGECHYTVIVGPDSAFRGSEGVELSEFRNEPVDTILVTEVTAGFCWMDPTKDITQSAAENGRTRRVENTPHDLTGISSNHSAIHFGLRDGSVQQLHPTSFKPLSETLKPILRGTSSKSAFD